MLSVAHAMVRLQRVSPHACEWHIGATTLVRRAPLVALRLLCFILMHFRAARTRITASSQHNNVLISGLPVGLYVSPSQIALRCKATPHPARTQHARLLTADAAACRRGPAQDCPSAFPVFRRDHIIAIASAAVSDCEPPPARRAAHFTTSFSPGVLWVYGHHGLRPKHWFQVDFLLRGSSITDWTPRERGLRAIERANQDTRRPRRNHESRILRSAPYIVI